MVRTLQFMTHSLSHAIPQNPSACLANSAKPSSKPFLWFQFSEAYQNPLPFHSPSSHSWTHHPAQAQRNWWPWPNSSVSTRQHQPWGTWMSKSSKKTSERLFPKWVLQNQPPQLPNKTHKESEPTRPRKLLFWSVSLKVTMENCVSFSPNALPTSPLTRVSAVSDTLFLCLVVFVFGFFFFFWYEVWEIWHQLICGFVVAGEVALPGGKAEEGDKDDGDTATREAKEEIGLDPSLVNVVTSLEPFLSKVL